MSRLTAAFASPGDAVAAREALAREGVPADVATAEGVGREVRFMTRVVLWIVLWSIPGGVVGAALGAGLAALLSSSSEGFIVQTISWMIFGHLIAGMWAGYVMLADRTGPDLPAVRLPALLTVDCANIDAIDMLADRLRGLGATSIELRED